ncbi:MAG TPA: Rieske 2Fe-2S domain-containing protein [Alphaproteobacteria bacterium]|jgi:phenylpropionate dioxygenase-like ring-hydroxylating dioxygenase large terminal subunit
MLTKEQNDLLTQTGPGTPCGEFLRSYWQPIASAEEMPLGGDPLPIRIMSEDLVLFRNEKDELGLIQRNCPHRGTDLSYGRIENGGIRCLYHGWLFDKDGKCLEQPAEKRSFCDTVKLVSYPVQEKGGAIWAYMGKGQPPLIPDFGFLLGPEANRLTFRVQQMCNWLQGLESSTDPVHTTFLHRRPVGTPSQRSGADIAAVRGIEVPEVSTEATSVGMRIYALHNAPNGKKYLRVNNYVYPTGATPSTSAGEGGYQGRWYVPVDDYSHFRFEFFYSQAEPLDKDRLRKNRAENVAPDLRHVRRPENRYMQDRELMKTGHFTGMGMHFPTQDAFAIETQGAIQDRTKENLGASDVVIASVRKTLFKAIKQVQDGKEAPGLIRTPADNPFADFVCTSGYIEDHEDGPSFCRRVLAAKTAAE